MREHIYQGKRIDNGEWIEGNLVHRTKIYDEPADAYFIMSKSDAEIDEISCIGIETDYDFYFAYEVNPDTVREFTGIWEKRKSKNNRRIFEGDIVLGTFHKGQGRKSDKYIGVIEFGEFYLGSGDYSVGFHICWVDHSMLRTSILHWRDRDYNSLKIIGNKWDNPELLRGDINEYIQTNHHSRNKT